MAKPNARRRIEQRALWVMFLATWLLVWCALIGMPAASDAVPALFTDVDLTPLGIDPPVQRVGPEVIRSRFVGVKFSLLEPLPWVDLGTQLALNLFGDFVHVVRLERFGETRAGHAWFGQIEGARHSQVIFVVVDGVLSGSVRCNGDLFLVEYAGDGVHAVYEIDEGHIPLDPPRTPEPTEPPPRAAGEPSALADDGSMIDVMVVYTPAARAGAGGTAQMHALIDLAIAGTNQAYQNSQVNPRLRLVYAGEVSYTESGTLLTDLERPKEPADGHMDEVHAWRDVVGADLVSLFVESGDYAGIAYLMNADWFRPEFERWAFSVVVRQYAVSNHTFAHELGGRATLESYRLKVENREVEGERRRG